MAQNSDYDPTDDLEKVGRNLEAIHSRYLDDLVLNETDAATVENDRLHLRIERSLEALERAYDCSAYRFGHIRDD